MRSELEEARLSELNLLERLARTRQRIRRLALQSHVPPVVATPDIQYYKCIPSHENAVRIQHRA